MAAEYPRADYITALALSQSRADHLRHPAPHKHESLQHARLPVSVIPDLRFEQTYLKRVKPYVHIERRKRTPKRADDDKKEEAGEGGEDEEEGAAEVITVEWGKVLWITTRDQVISPLLQGALWGAAAIFIRPAVGSLGARVRQWWPTYKEPPPGHEGKGVGFLRSWAKSLFGGAGTAFAGIASVH